LGKIWIHPGRRARVRLVRKKTAGGKDTVSSQIGTGKHEDPKKIRNG